jgi:hypothetical protein
VLPFSPHQICTACAVWPEPLFCATFALSEMSCVRPSVRMICFRNYSPDFEYIWCYFMLNVVGPIQFRDSSVSIESRLRDGRPGFDSRQGPRILVANSSRPALGPTRSPIPLVPGALSSGVNWPPRSAEVKFGRSYTSSLPYVFMAWRFLNTSATLLAVHEVRTKLGQLYI